MSLHVALTHRTSYRYDRPVMLGPQTIRLRPAPHARTPVLSYSLGIAPEPHFINWQQDPHGNWLARAGVSRTGDRRVRRWRIDLTADMTVINPFDFFVAALRRIPSRSFTTTVLGARSRRRIARSMTRRSRSLQFRRWPELDDRAARRTIGLPGRDQPCGAVARKGRLCRAAWSPACSTAGCHPGAAASGSCRDSAPGCSCRCSAPSRPRRAFRFRLPDPSCVKADIETDWMARPGHPGSDFTDLHAWAEGLYPGRRLGRVRRHVRACCCGRGPHPAVPPAPHYRSCAAAISRASGHARDQHFDFSMSR